MAKLQDGRRKLTWEQMVEIANRYSMKLQTGETSQSIADEFQICRQYVPAIARRVKKKAPRSDQRRG